MSEPFLGEIQMFAGTFAPRGWAFCDGQLLATSQNDALFALLGTFYGGDGRSTFGLPDLRGRVPVHAGSGPGLPSRSLGERGGSEQVAPTNNQLPVHTHAIASTGQATTGNPGGKVVGKAGEEIFSTITSPTSNSVMNAQVGGRAAHNNVMPFQCVNFIIALSGIFPSRS